MLDRGGTLGGAFEADALVESGFVRYGCSSSSSRSFWISASGS
jgi:hypothetical protein